MPTVNAIVKVLNQLAPPYLAENWDNVGLLIGSKKAAVSKVLCALDITEDVVQEAITLDADCIVTHHPVIFKPLSRINFDEPKGRMIQQLIVHNIAVFALHTNLDSAEYGTSDFLAEKLQIKNLKVLQPTFKEPFYKFVVYVPEESYETVRQTIIDFDKEHVGNYKGCTFTTEGEGTFIPLLGSNPFIGTTNKLEVVHERKIECIISKCNVAQLLEKVKKAHPYEEVAYDLFPLENLGKNKGLGRYGEIEATKVESLVAQLKTLLKIPYVRVIGNLDRTITNIALCTGSGSSFIKQAAECAELYITGDMGFHDGQEAIQRGLTVVDIGHYASENIVMPFIKDYLIENVESLEVICSQINGEVFNIV